LEIKVRTILGKVEHDSWLIGLELNLTHKRKSLNGIFMQLYLTVYISLLDVGLIPHITFIFYLVHDAQNTLNFKFPL